MSEENLEIVRRMYDAWQRGDFETALPASIPAWSGLSHRTTPGRGHGMGTTEFKVR